MYKDTPTPCLENWPKIFKKGKKKFQIPCTTLEAGGRPHGVVRIDANDVHISTQKVFHMPSNENNVIKQFNRKYFHEFFSLDLNTLRDRYFWF